MATRLKHSQTQTLGWQPRLPAGPGWVESAMADRHVAALRLPLPLEILCGARHSVTDSFPGVIAKDTLTPGKMAVGLGAVRAVRPQVGRPTAAFCSKSR